MLVRRLVSGLMTLMAVQFAVLGAQPLCAGDHHGAASAGTMSDMSHGDLMDHGPVDPCAPTTPDSHAGHSLLSCLAMTGCAPTGLASLGTPGVAIPLMTVQMESREPAAVLAVTTPPETPPPIA